MAEGQTELPRPKNNVIDFEAALQKRRQENKTPASSPAPSEAKNNVINLEAVRKKLWKEQKRTGKGVSREQDDVWRSSDNQGRKWPGKGATREQIEERLAELKLPLLTDEQWKEWKRLTQDPAIEAEERRKRREEEWVKKYGFRPLPGADWDKLLDQHNGDVGKATDALIRAEKRKKRADFFSRLFSRPHQQEAFRKQWDIYVLGQPPEDKDKPIGEIIGETIVRGIDYLFAAIGKALKPRVPTKEKHDKLSKTG